MTLHYICTRPHRNIINCRCNIWQVLTEINQAVFRSEEREKDWKIVFDFIFSGDGLINQGYFITKHVRKLVTHLSHEVNSGQYFQG